MVYMKKLINIRNSVIIILCITIICMAIGFIVISVEYTKKAKENLVYNVVFTKVKKLSSVKGSNTEPKGEVKINDNLSEIEMNITLESPHDELSFLATIENEGTVPIEIVDIMESPDYKLDSFKKLINPVTITLSDIEGKVIEPNETLDLKIVFYYNGTASGTKTFDYKLGLITKTK